MFSDVGLNVPEEVPDADDGFLFFSDSSWFRKI